MSRCNILSWCLMALCAVVFFTYSGEKKRSAGQLQQDIAGQIIRFHVRANSDTDEDQQLKLLVKEELVTYIGDILKDVKSRDDAEKILSDNIENIENIAKGVIKDNKKEYNVKAYFEDSYFPVKVYGDMTFPQGIYEAFRVDIGAADGKNWWCVLYPNLCFLDKTCAVVSDEGKEDLKGVLTDEEYQLLTDNKELKVKWFFFGD